VINLRTVVGQPTNKLDCFGGLQGSFKDDQTQHPGNVLRKASVLRQPTLLKNELTTMVKCQPNLALCIRINRRPCRSSREKKFRLVFATTGWTPYINHYSPIKSARVLKIVFIRKIGENLKKW